MGTSTALPNLAESASPSIAGVHSEQALIPSPPAAESDTAFPQNRLAARLPVELDVAVPLKDFRVRNLLALQPGTVVESQWSQGDDLPLGSGDVQLAWSEFEVVDSQLSVRLTRLV